MGNTAASYYRNRATQEVDKKVFAVIGGVGILCALTVFVEMCEKLGGSESPNWSALRLMGPQIWIPLKTKEDRNIAIIIMIFSIMYIASCALLVYGGWKRVKDLSLTWKLTECGVLVYQIIAALITASSFSAIDSVILSLDTVLGVVALIYTRIAETTWQDVDSDTEAEPRRPSAAPSLEDISGDPAGPGDRQLQLQPRRASEAVAGPSGLAGPSGIPRPASQLQLRELDGDSDSLEDVPATVEEQPVRPVVTPRRKKSSVRTTQATVHSSQEDLQEISVAADPERPLGAITEESASDISRGSPPAMSRSPPRESAAAEGGEAREGSPKGASACAAEPAAAAETPVPQQGSPTRAQFLEQMLATSAETPCVTLSLPTETSQVSAEAETTREQPAPAGDSEPSQGRPSPAAASSEAETAPKPSTDTAVSVADAGSSSPAEQPLQVATGVDAVVAAADSKTGGAEDEAAPQVAEQPATGAEVSTEVKQDTRM